MGVSSTHFKRETMSLTSSLVTVTVLSTLILVGEIQAKDRLSLSKIQKEIFDLYDVYKWGCFSWHVFKNIGDGATKSGFDKADADGNGCLKYQEAMTAIMDWADLDGDGCLNLQEFKNLG